ncbi:MAG: hypothetical protein IT317_20845 [Anaerolineales bacterium]|nr:hypothetical protein [Anaerolineales bacterium]
MPADAHDHEHDHAHLPTDEDAAWPEWRGDDKLSDLLGDFLAPYSQLAEDEQSYRNLLRIGIAAWNLALFPPDQHPALLDELVSPERLAVAEAARAEMRALLEALVARKREKFAAEQRYIVDFDLRQGPEGFQLAVASTLPQTRRG